jgi:hypothetical protein
MGLFKSIGKGLGNLFKGATKVVSGAIGVAAGALGIGGGGQSTVRIAVETSPTTGTTTQATVTRPPASPIPAGSDRTTTGDLPSDVPKAGGNTALLIAGALVGLLLLSQSRSGR